MKNTLKRILSIIAVLIAVLCFCLGVYAIVTGQIGGSLRAFAVAALFGIASAILFKGAKEKTVEKDIPSDPARNRNESKYDFLHFTVAGVTFKNDDGRHRQTILRKMRFGDAPYDNGYSASLEEYEFQGKPAIAVLVNGDMIGNVPREAVQSVIAFMERPGCCVTHIDVYGGGRKKGSSETLNYGAEVTLRCNR